MSNYFADQDRDDQFAGSPSGSPLRSVEAFDAYCAEVQQKLAVHAAHRFTFLQSAFDRLSSLLQAARDVEDPGLVGELNQHRLATMELLNAVRRVQGSEVPAAPVPSAPPAPRPAPPVQAAYVPPAPVQQAYNPAPPVQQPYNPAPQPQAPAAPAASGPFSRPTPVPIVPPVSQLSRRAEVVNPNAVASEAPAASNVSRAPRRPMRPLIDIEGDAIALRQELKEWAKSHPLNTEAGELNIPNCLRLRSLACRHRRLEEECGDTEVAEVTELSEDIIDLLDSANDQEYTVALDDELDPRPTAYQWGELADRYNEMARAQEGFEWWQQHRHLLAVSDVQPLAEAVAAVQQRFNRLLFRIGARDPFQQQLFDDLRTWAREDQCYLYSLRPKVPMAELMEKAATLEDAWDRARIPVADEERRQTLVESVIALVSEPDFGEHGDHDEDVLREQLWDCKNNRVSPADKRLKEALAPWTSFMETDERFKDMLREVTMEWEAQLEANSLAEGPGESAGDPPAAELTSIRTATSGKKALILGGAPTDATRARFTTALELGELTWESPNPNDTLETLAPKIEGVDIVILVTRYSRKEWKGIAELCTKAGKKFASVASTADLPVTVRHLIKQLVSATPTSRRKSTAASAQ
jgi:hypothetical protein